MSLKLRLSVTFSFCFTKVLRRLIFNGAPFYRNLGNSRLCFFLEDAHCSFCLLVTFPNRRNWNKGRDRNVFCNCPSVYDFNDWLSGRFYAYDIG